jgi:L-cysteine desulfidase
MERNDAMQVGGMADAGKVPMRHWDAAYRAYTAVLRRELVPAMGCTEPIAVAYAAALARDLAGGLPDRILVEASGSIIKNVKSVVVPHTGGLKGLEAAAAVGVLAGDASRELDLLAKAGADTGAAVREWLAGAPVEVAALESEEVFDLRVTTWRGASTGRVRLTGGHTRVVLRERDGVAVGGEDGPLPEAATEADSRDWMTVPGIWEYVEALEIADVRKILERQIRCNLAIAEEGLRGDWGAGIGKVVLATGRDDVRTRAKAWPAAASDARMGGCEMPVVINSGSGNQGLTVSLPVVAYARELGSSDDDLYRALALANLVAIHQKDGIGCLSAFCGATTAAAGAGAGVAYLRTRDYHTVVHAIVNALAILPGMACDGAKASCAAKIAEAVDAALLGVEMILAGRQFYGGDGLVTKGVEATIRNIARLGHDGMRETNGEIIRIMLRNPAAQG